MNNPRVMKSWEERSIIHEPASISRNQPNSIKGFHASFRSSSLGRKQDQTGGVDD